MHKNQEREYACYGALGLYEALWIKFDIHGDEYKFDDWVEGWLSMPDWEVAWHVIVYM